MALKKAPGARLALERLVPKPTLGVVIRTLFQRHRLALLGLLLAVGLSLAARFKDWGGLGR